MPPELFPKRIEFKNRNKVIYSFKQTQAEGKSKI